MTALDVSSFVAANEDTPELAAFKRRVLAVAKAHSKRSHCGSLAGELDELGIKEERKIAVKVTTTHPFNLEVQVYPSELQGKDEDAQRVVIANAIGDLQMAGASGTFIITVPPSSIASMEIGSISPDAPEDEQFVWLFGTEAGRVLHRYSVARIEEARTLNDRIWSACDNYTYPNWTRVDNNGARRCQPCQTKINNGTVSTHSLPQRRR